MDRIESTPSTDRALVPEEQVRGWNHYIWDGVQTAWQFMWSAFYDGNHPAKQLKYQCLLAEIADFPREWVTNENTPIQIALRCLTSHETDYRKRHHDFLKHLREAIRQNHDCEIAMRLVSNMYNARMYSYAEGLISWGAMQGYRVQYPDSDKPLNELSILEIHEALQHIPQKDLAPFAAIWYHSAMATMGISFDPNMTGNVPYHLFELQLAGRKISFIRSASPVCLIDGKHQLAPEYQALLTPENRVHYVSLQSPSSGAEGEYSDAIRAGFTAHDFIALDHDSPFYLEAEGTPDSSARFRMYLLNELFNSKHFVFPESWANDKKFIEIIKKTLDQIAEHVFEEKKELTKDEKRDFIDIFYSYLIFLQVGYYMPDIVTICCRDAADRHGKVLFLLHILITLFEGQSVDESSFERVVLTFAPPLIGRKKPMLHRRFERLYSAMQRLTKEGVPEFFSTLGTDLPISHTVTRKAYQEKAWQDLLSN